MDPFSLISKLDGTALEELAVLIRRMADDTAELRTHAILPVSVTMLDNRRRILVGLVEMMEELAESPI